MNTVELGIVIIGVGGQGTLLASRILGALAMGLGRDVKVSEVHGMAQRGGSVMTFFRMGESVHAPILDPACADYVLAFEKLEAVRALPYLKPGGTVIVNTQEVLPMPVITGAAKYPSDLVDVLNQCANVVAFDAAALARAAGEPRAVNLVLLGAFARFTSFDRATWDRAIEESVPSRLLKVNEDAFEAGYQICANRE